MKAAHGPEVVGGNPGRGNPGRDYPSWFILFVSGLCGSCDDEQGSARRVKTPQRGGLWGSWSAHISMFTAT
jgi:hypothetical protein